MAVSDSSPELRRFERTIPLRQSRGNIGPFRATQIWNEIISHVKSKVELKRRRYKMRHYDNTFTGTDAVDVVLHYLLSDKETFCTDLSRDKAVKVCQMLINQNVFEPASCRSSEGKKLFEDSNSKLYRFVDSDKENKDDSPLDDSEASTMDDSSDFKSGKDLRINPAFEPDLLEDDLLCNPLALQQSASVMQELIKLGSSIRCKSASSLKSIDLKRTRSSDSQEISPEVVEETWKEIALAELLTIVDIMFLDGILSEEKENKRQQRRNIIISNVVAKHSVMPFLEGSDTTDCVMQAAFDCIECLPKGMALLADDTLKQAGTQTKLKLFKIISKYYQDLSDPLLPERFFDLHMAILNLILTGREETGLLALKLDVVLLPWAVREELQRLLKFMLAIAKDNTFRIDVQETNEVIVLRTFSGCIFKHKVLSSSVGAELVQFFLNHLSDIFIVPRSIRQKVAFRLYQVKTGIMEIVSDSTFCSRVTQEEYQKQSEDGTKEALIEMMNSVLDDTQVPLKEKKQRLKCFQKIYPALYEKYFQGLI
ncbi:DEP domain-containing protein 7-like isoform X1 [Haliotis rufescens]|uniref:DEP domain-containing protein 7-like isoform X1 n=2 Tax=Haliotis rufescens TaxID=6454 RepID=UPI001EB08403|nr:DEP domain-containing protein 7-like isoform X1 [Haliotis rufescens]